MLWCLRFGGVGAGSLEGLDWQYWYREQFAGSPDVGAAPESAPPPRGLKTTGDELAHRHVFDHAPAQWTDGLVGHGDAPV
jgi:hypothetical protein